MSRISFALKTAFFSCLLIWTSATQGSAASVGGQEFLPMENWEPGDFLISCGDVFGELSPSSPSLDCPNSSHPNVQEFEIAAISALDHLRKIGLKSPYHFGPVMYVGSLVDTLFGNETEAIRVFTGTDPGAYAHISPLGSSNAEPCSREGFRAMTIFPSAMLNQPSHNLSRIAAHELFHAIQFGIPGLAYSNNIRGGGCLPANWITEAMADAVGIDFMRREYRYSFPPNPKDPSSGYYAGLRSYSDSLHRPGSGTDGYKTSSFWLYLADRFHNRNLSFLADYLSHEPPIFASNVGPVPDWLRWLDDRLMWDNDVQTPFHFVYPRFLTYFASDWAKGGVGEKYNPKEWLKNAFTCKQVVLSPQNAYEEFGMELAPISGKCLIVSIEGIAPSDLVSVKVGVLTSNIQVADSLHLGLAFTNDATGFNCSKASREGSLPAGVDSCLLEPWTGEFLESASPNAGVRTPAARLWYGSSIEKGTVPQTSGEFQGLTNVYVLSHVPVKSWQSQIQGQPWPKFRVGVGLDWAALNVDGNDVNTGQNDGSRSAARRRAAAALGIYPIETDRMIPATIGNIDIDGVGRAFEAFLNRQNPGVSINKILEAQNGVNFGTEFVSFRLADTEVIPITGPIPEETLEIVREFLVMVEDVIPVGTTGTFKGTIQGNDRNKPDFLYYSPVPAQVEILENSHGAFRARVDGIVCEMDLNPMKLMLGNVNKCRRSFFVSGGISKPFAYLYRADTELTSIETEGERYYDRFNAPRRNLRFGGNGAAPSAPSQPDDTHSDGNDNSGSGIQCACECPNVATPASNRCVGQCFARLQSCEAVDAPSAAETSVDRLAELLRERSLPLQAQEMLISDFTTMSEETQAHIIEWYQK